MSRSVRRALAALLTAAAVGCAACQPGPPVPPPPVPAAAEPVVVADSITWQALLSGGFDGTGYRADAVMMGWKLDTPQVQTAITEARDAGTLDELVVALGTNDANPVWNGGWTDHDRNVWAATLLGLNRSTKLVIVLPWIGPGGDPEHAAEVDQARADIRTIADIRGERTVVVDWQDYAGPGVLRADGIHLPGVTGDEVYPAAPVAVDARMRAIADGLAAVS